MIFNALCHLRLFFNASVRCWFCCLRVGDVLFLFEDVFARVKFWVLSIAFVFEHVLDRQSAVHYNLLISLALNEAGWLLQAALKTLSILLTKAKRNYNFNRTKLFSRFLRPFCAIPRFCVEGLPKIFKFWLFCVDLVANW